MITYFVKPLTRLWVFTKTVVILGCPRTCCAHRKGAITASMGHEGSEGGGGGMTSACEASSGDMTRRIPEPNNPPLLRGFLNLGTPQYRFRQGDLVCVVSGREIHGCALIFTWQQVVQLYLSTWVQPHLHVHHRQGRLGRRWCDKLFKSHDRSDPLKDLPV